MKDKKRRKSRATPARNPSAGKKQQKTKVIYSQSRFIGETKGTGPLGLDGRELGLFTHERKRPDKEQWVCSTEFHSCEHRKHHLGEEYRFSVNLIELFEGHYAKIAQYQNTRTDSSIDRGQVREVALRFTLVLASEYHIAELPAYCPEEALQLLCAKRIILDLRLEDPDLDSLSDLQVDRFTELIWWLILYVYRFRMMKRLTRESIANNRQKLSELQTHLTTQREALSLAQATECELQSLFEAAQRAHHDAFQRWERTCIDARSAGQQIEEKIEHLQSQINSLQHRLANAKQQALNTIRNQGVEHSTAKEKQRIAEAIAAELTTAEQQVTAALAAQSKAALRLRTLERQRDSELAQLLQPLKTAQLRLDEAVTATRAAQETLAATQQQFTEVETLLHQLEAE